MADLDLEKGGLVIREQFQLRLSSMCWQLSTGLFLFSNMQDHHVACLRHCVSPSHHDAISSTLLFADTEYYQPAFPTIMTPRIPGSS